MFPQIADETYTLASKLIRAIALQYSQTAASARAGIAVLVFLPGMMAIDTMYDDLGLTLTPRWCNAWLDVLVMHSTIPLAEMQAAFGAVPPGRTRIILATNIAESSLTLGNVDYVLDFGLRKEIRYDDRLKVARQVLTWVSKSSSKQRAGRTGRLAPGTVFHLYTEGFYSGMADYDAPEMLRVPLENVVLRAKTMDVGLPSQILARAINPPAPDAIAVAVRTLFNQGAIVR